MTEVEAMDAVRAATGDPVGMCYVASEALYHLLGGKDAGYTPMQMIHEGGSHWYLRTPDGRYLDPTVEQFTTTPEWATGRGRGFQTRQPSKIAQRIIDAVRARS